MNSLFLTDGYKLGHHQQYPQGTTKVYSNWTARRNSYGPKTCEGVVFFGLQLALAYLDNHFKENFFQKDKQEVCNEAKVAFSNFINADYDVTHFEQLHDLGYLPINVKALPEGTVVPFGVPMFTIENTLPEFYWITNYLETILSNLLWHSITTATIAREYKKILTKYALETDKDNIGFVGFQAHDFSMRGLSGDYAGLAVGLGHATSFNGSDNLSTIQGAKKYYKHDIKEFLIGGVPATEHSVMCAGGMETELETYRRLLNIYPTGILSVVSDTWDLWKVITEHLPALKDEIMNRDGKLVIRPDSGDPVDILCGTIDYHKHSRTWEENSKNYNEKYGWNSPKLHTRKGVIELLWDIFGGTVNEQGYKVLDPHIGAIYGDSITLERCEEICSRLKAKGFASTNVVFGVGSYTYQYQTRDTFGMALKSTYVEINGEGVDIYKNPITDDGSKKSAKGLLSVIRVDGKLTLAEGTNNHPDNLLYSVFNSSYRIVASFEEIRRRINVS